jgi:GR25 family glycosyltransferase involved in LPS biosynthesis
VAPAVSLPESSACQVQTLRLCQGTCRAHGHHGGNCVQTKAGPPESCDGASTSVTSPLFAMYVLNVPGEDERWRRMLRVLEDSFLPGPLVHRFDTVPLDDYRIVEYPEKLFEHISWPQRYSNLLSHVEAWQHFSTDPDADDNAWALFFEDDIVVHPDVRGDRRRLGAILKDGFALGAVEGFVYLGLCGMKTVEQVQREWKDKPQGAIAQGYRAGSLQDGWLAINGPHGPLYLHRETNTYTVHPPLSPGVESSGATCKHAGHGVEHIKGCGTCLHAYGVAKWRAKTLWRQLESIPWEEMHPITYPPDALTLDVYLFQAMVGGVLPMVWNLGANLTDPSHSGNQGLAFQDSYLPGGILY